MKRILIAAASLTALMAPTANAAIDLKQVPALCGTSAEVLGTLSAKMPNPEAIGIGGDSHGAPIATLFKGDGYWALIAMMSPDSVCVVASGHNWTVTEPTPAKAF